MPSVSVRPDKKLGVGRARLFDSPRKQNLLLSLILIFSIVAIYYPVHHHAFINLDDGNYVFANPHIASGLDWPTVKWALLHGSQAIPLTWLSHALDVQLFELEPAGHHDMNVVLHALDVVLLFWVLKRATGYAGRSFMVAMLFAVHPINVENVAWVAERKTMLSMLFFLLTLGAYRWYARAPKTSRYVVVAGLFALGLLAKPQVITLPFVLLLWDYWPLQRMRGSEPDLASPIPAGEVFPARDFSALVKEKVPLFVIAAANALVTPIAQHVGIPEHPFPIRLENAVFSYPRYLVKAFWPSGLSVYYLHPGSSLRWWQVCGALLFLVAVTALVARARSHRYLLVGWLWLLGTLVPMIGLVEVDSQGMADRYAYLPFIGLFIMICWGIADWAEQRRLSPAFLPAVSIVVLLSLAVVAHRQVGYWSDSVTLWSHGLQVTPDSPRVEQLLGLALQGQGQEEQAIAHFLRAAAIKPTNPQFNLSVADYEYRHRNLPLAIQYYEMAVPGLRQQPGQHELLARVLTVMGMAYRDLGDSARATQCFEAAALPAPPEGINWQGAWWREIGPYIRARF